MDEDFRKHCEPLEKLNRKDQLLEAKSDPLFMKQIKLFDSDSLSSLLLNAFQVANGSIKMFLNQ